MARYEMIGNHKIFFDETYYIAYAGGNRELPSKDQKEWNKTLQLPGELKIREQLKLGYDKNPNVIPLKGIDLLSFIKELQFIPFFDHYFEHTHILKLTDIIIYESIKAKSYDIALRK
jgi:hypothetical protein